MDETPGRTYLGNAAGGNATIDAALDNAIANAAKGEQVNHFSWRVYEIRGDWGGIVGRNITVEIVVRR
jgi:flavin-binding protein dodecin